MRMVGAATDITERKRAEEALHEANRTLEERVAARTAELEEERNLLRTVIDTVPDFIYVKDRQRRMLLNNVAHARSLVARGDVDPLGKTDDELFPADMAAGFYADEEQLFLAGQSIKNREERTIGEDGGEIWALTTKVPLQNLRGEVIGLVGITKDITAIKTGAEALRASEERYRATIAAMSEGVVVQGTDGAIQLCNEAAERILGLTVDQMVGLTSIDPRWQAVHEDGSPFPGETHPAMVALRTGESQSDVVMGVHKPDGALTWILVNAQPLFHPGGSQPYAVVATFADITARKQAEQTLRQALAQEKELGELKSRFVTLASHEFRTPLAAILATTETLTNYWDRLDKPKIDDRLGRIRAQVAHMTSIMEDVLELARMQAGRVKYEPAPGDLDALCRAILTEYEDQADQGRRLIYECAQPPVLSVFDTRMLRQVIGNLVQNALKYSPESHPVWVTLVHDGEQITLRVQDEGIGIPPEDMKRLFETFHRAANVGAISGTGLGLSIAKQAVELHGGTIAVESALDRGTTFTVRLPRVE
ncbi:MAG: PAS domain S-box protein [Chloroflexi bacterium]|nr:PAS domain S-box protein [Chloroflexota bacterium]